MSAATSLSSIVPFPSRQARGNKFTMRDRMEALDWTEAARVAGYPRITIDSGAEDGEPELGDFILVYRRDALWASWGVGCCEGGFIVWHPSNGATRGWYPSLSKALDSIPPVE